MKEFLFSIGVNLGLAVSGFFGSLLLIGKQKNQNLREQVFSIIGGTMSANYLTPVVLETLKIENESLKYGFAFVIGFGGLKFVEVIYERYIQKLKPNKNADDN
jgi:hypothetical protein